MNAFITRLGKAVGNVVGVLYQAGRDAIDMVIKNVLPFIAFIAFVIGLILETGVGEWLADGLSGLASSLPGLLLLAVIIGLPVLSPLLGPLFMLSFIYLLTSVLSEVVSNNAVAVLVTPIAIGVAQQLRFPVLPKYFSTGLGSFSISHFGPTGRTTAG